MRKYSLSIAILLSTFFSPCIFSANLLVDYNEQKEEYYSTQPKKVYDYTHYKNVNHTKENNLNDRPFFSKDDEVVNPLSRKNLLIEDYAKRYLPHKQNVNILPRLIINEMGKYLGSLWQEVFSIRSYYVKFHPKLPLAYGKDINTEKGYFFEKENHQWKEAVLKLEKDLTVTFHPKLPLAFFRDYDNGKRSLFEKVGHQWKEVLKFWKKVDIMFHETLPLAFFRDYGNREIYLFEKVGHRWKEVLRMEEVSVTFHAKLPLAFFRDYSNGKRSLFEKVGHQWKEVLKFWKKMGVTFHAKLSLAFFRDYGNGKRSLFEKVDHQWKQILNLEEEGEVEFHNNLPLAYVRDYGNNKTYLYEKVGHQWKEVLNLGEEREVEFHNNLPLAYVRGYGNSKTYLYEKVGQKWQKVLNKDQKRKKGKQDFLRDERIRGNQWYEALIGKEQVFFSKHPTLPLKAISQQVGQKWQAYPLSEMSDIQQAPWHGQSSYNRTTIVYEQERGQWQEILNLGMGRNITFHGTLSLFASYDEGNGKNFVYEKVY